jgi:long-chain acyl-CoA synthetase
MEPRTWHRAYDPGVSPGIDFSRTTLPEHLREAATRFADRPAIRFLNRSMSYRELDREVDRFAAALASLGVGKGDRVAIQLPNLPQTVISFYGTLRLGAVAVMTNPLYVEREIEHQWNDAGCRVAITTDFLYAGRVAGMRSRLSVEHVVVAAIAEYMRFPLKQLAPRKLRRAKPPLCADVKPGPGVHLFRKLVASAPDIGPATKVAGGELAALQYTGGTTGSSKGAMLSHGNLSCQTQQLRAWMPELVPGEEVFLGVLPFFHVFGLSVAMALPVYLGSEIVILPNPRDVPAIIGAINKRRVTVFPIVPAMVNGINQSPKVGSLKVGSLKICVSGSAPLPESVLRSFEERTGGRVVEGYGLTEASPVTHTNPSKGVRKVCSIGLPIPDTDCRIVSLDDGRDVPPGAEGELLIRGPQVMQGYWNRPDETAATLQEGWLHTGDLASVDAEGYFRIVGRKKELIIAGGFKIYPDEVDQVLVSHPSILEAATIGVPDARRGETVKSFVVFQPGKSATEAELVAWCRERLAAYKIPRVIEVRMELPKSSVLKILRRKLLEEELAARS